MSEYNTLLPTIRNATADSGETAVETLEKWAQMAWDRYYSTSTYSPLHDFYEGYGSALNDALGLLKKSTEVAEKASHKALKGALIGLAVSAGVVAYKRYQNGVLLPSQRDRD